MEEYNMDMKTLQKLAELLINTITGPCHKPTFFEITVKALLDNNK